MTDTDKRNRAAELRADGHTHAEIAGAVDVSVRTVERWQAADVLPTPPDTELEHATLTEARRRRELARARMSELDLAERRGQLVTRDAYEASVGRLLDTLRQNITAMEGRWATQFPGTEPRAAGQVLNRMIRELLEHLSGPAADALARSEPPALLPAGDANAELPEDCPGRAALIAAGVSTIGALLALDDLQEIPGIGPATEAKILDALEAHHAA